MAGRKKFLRRNHDKQLRLGGRRKKLVWRRPKGIHNKMRERREGYPQRPEIGMKNYNEQIKLVRNIKELEKCARGEKVIVASVGKKLRAEMERKAVEMGLKIQNMRKTGK